MPEIQWTPELDTLLCSTAQSTLFDWAAVVEALRGMGLSQLTPNLARQRYAVLTLGASDSDDDLSSDDDAVAQGTAGVTAPAIPSSWAPDPNMEQGTAAQPAAAAQPLPDIRHDEMEQHWAAFDPAVHGSAMEYADSILQRRAATQQSQRDAMFERVLQSLGGPLPEGVRAPPAPQPILRPGREILPRAKQAGAVIDVDRVAASDAAVAESRAAAREARAQHEAAISTQIEAMRVQLTLGGGNQESNLPFDDGSLGAAVLDALTQRLPADWDSRPVHTEDLRDVLGTLTQAAAAAEAAVTSMSKPADGAAAAAAVVAAAPRTPSRCPLPSSDSESEHDEWARGRAAVKRTSHERTPNTPSAGGAAAGAIPHHVYMASGSPAFVPRTFAPKPKLPSSSSSELSAGVPEPRSHREELSASSDDEGGVDALPWRAQSEQQRRLERAQHAAAFLATVQGGDDDGEPDSSEQADGDAVAASLAKYAAISGHAFLDQSSGAGMGGMGGMGGMPPGYM